jgi:hypothetical protein
MNNDLTIITLTSASYQDRLTHKMQLKKRKEAQAVRARYFSTPYNTPPPPPTRILDVDFVITQLTLLQSTYKL